MNIKMFYNQEHELACFILKQNNNASLMSLKSQQFEITQAINVLPRQLLMMI